MATKPLKGFEFKNGKLRRIPGYGLDASAKIRARKSKRKRVGRRVEKRNAP